MIKLIGQALLTLIALISLNIGVYAAQDQLPPANWQVNGPQTHAENILSELIQGNTEKAFKLFFSKGRYSQQTLEKLQFDYYQTVKKQGEPVAYEKIFEQRIGTSLVRIKYVLLFKTVPMMFDLYYYDTGKDWALKSFTISRDIKKVFER